MEHFPELIKYLIEQFQFINRYNTLNTWKEIHRRLEEAVAYGGLRQVKSNLYAYGDFRIKTMLWAGVGKSGDQYYRSKREYVASVRCRDYNILFLHIQPDEFSSPSGQDS